MRLPGDPDFLTLPAMSYLRKYSNMRSRTLVDMLILGLSCVPADQLVLKIAKRCILPGSLNDEPGLRMSVETGVVSLVHLMDNSHRLMLQDHRIAVAKVVSGVFMLPGLK